MFYITTWLISIFTNGGKDLKSKYATSRVYESLRFSIKKKIECEKLSFFEV